MKITRDYMYYIERVLWDTKKELTALEVKQLIQSYGYHHIPTKCQISCFLLRRESNAIINKDRYPYTYKIKEGFLPYWNIKSKKLKGVKR